MIARRLFTLSDNVDVATEMFPPLNYGCVGLSQEAAKAQFGKGGFDIILAYYEPTESFILQENPRRSHLKALFNDGKIVGLHYFWPFDGDVIQGICASFK